MRKVRMTVDELIEELRLQGVTDLNSVKYAILETSGQVSVLLYQDRQPATPKQLGLSVQTGRLPVVVINDGRVLSQNLTALGLDENWLNQQLKQRGAASPKAVFLLTADRDGVIHYAPREVTP